MLTYDLSNRGSESRYVYLYQCIRRDIEAGIIAAGTRLPSKRALAQHLGVSLITVEGAYAQLVAEGYVESRPRRGYYALPLEGAAAHASFELESPRILAESAAEGCFSKDCSKERHVVSVDFDSDSEEGFAQDDLIDLTGARAARGVFPYGLWAKMVRQALADESEETLVSEASPMGSMRLRRALADYLKGLRNMDVSPDQIVVAAGAQVLYGLLVQLLGRDRVFAIENPGYPRLARIYASQGAAIHPISLDCKGMSVEALRSSDASIAHVTPSHQYPTGMVMPVGRRYELLGWAVEERGRYIIEDDYDCELRLAGRPMPALQSADVQGSVIYANTFTKTLGPALRLGYMVLPPELTERYREQLGFYSCTVSSIDQLALARMLEGGHYERHVNRLRSHCRKTRDALLEALRASSLGGRLSFENVDAGLHFVMRVDGDLAAQELVSRAFDQGVRVHSLQDFLLENEIAKAPGEKSSVFASDAGHGIVVAYSSLDLARVSDAVARLERAWA